MARIKIEQVNEYYNVELIGVFSDEVCILGGGYTEEEAIAEMKANAETWLEEYGKGKTLYGWHISNLKIYDRPKELSEFKKTKEKIAMTCGMQASNGLCRAIDYEELCDNIKCCFKTPRPSQSWCYVEELEK